MPFVTGSTVQSAKDRLNPSFLAFNTDMASCAAVPAASRAAWGPFFQSWQTFYAQDETTVANELSAGSRMDQTEQFGKDLNAWQAQYSAWQCRLSAPPLSPSTYQPPPLVKQATDAAQSTILPTLTTLAWIGGIGLLGYLAVMYGPAVVSKMKAA